MSEHEWVTYDTLLLTLIAGSGKKQLVAPASRVRSNDMFFQRAALRAGCGLGVLPSFLADDDVTNGALVRVLPDWLVFSGSVLLVHPAHRRVPRKVAAFQELLQELLRQRPISPPVR